MPGGSYVDPSWHIALSSFYLFIYFLILEIFLFNLRSWESLFSRLKKQLIQLKLFDFSEMAEESSRPIRLMNFVSEDQVLIQSRIDLILFLSL